VIPYRLKNRGIYYLHGNSQANCCLNRPLINIQQKACLTILPKQPRQPDLAFVAVLSIVQPLWVTMPMVPVCLDGTVSRPWHDLSRYLAWTCGWRKKND
jgi:hypothetical protein